MSILKAPELFSPYFSGVPESRIKKDGPSSRNDPKKGSMFMFLSGLIVRLLSGEEVFSIPPIIKWPGFDEETETQRFPFKTTIMLINLCTLYERHHKTYVKV